MKEIHTPAASNVNLLFQEISKNNSSKLAIKDENNFLTYNDLDRTVNNLAHWLKTKHHFEKNEVIAIIHERSVETVTAMLAILRIGGVFLPIDPSLPIARIEYMLKDSEAVHILTSRKLEVNYKNRTNSLIVIDDILKLPQYSDLSLVDIEKSDPAYIIYTSGSTGKPKGVVTKHEGLSNLTSVFTNDLDIKQHDRVLQFASISFDASIWEIFMAFFTGASLHIVPQNIIMNPRHFENYLNINKISILTLGPAYLAYLNPSNIEHIKTVITAGSQISSDLVKKWSKFEYVNAYGPTETTICATLWKRTNMEEIESIPIGKAIQNCEAYVMDANLNELPAGQTGELCIAGINLAIGYLNNDEMTNKKFIFCEALGKRLYRTGDQAKLTNNNDLIYLGRIDDQIKIRGYRIEIGEIEYYLKTYPEILDACVKVVKDSQNQDHLCAYYLSDEAINNIHVKEFLSSYLPGYMVPNHLIRLYKFPLNFSGKVDKSKLHSPF
ncbi:amino acid adenylation domain-containing protein [Paenibacillus sp. FSL R5-0749]|uniref:amino acid adenylation domain-containing protein n=1 Tax=Paenibacillus sp. FSL R5-0749 TaxID=2921657 RepID=UPI00315A0C69